MLVFFLHWAGIHLFPRLHTGAVGGGWVVRASEIEVWGKNRKAMTAGEAVPASDWRVSKNNW